MNSPSGAVSEADCFCVLKLHRISSPKSRKPVPTTTTAVPPSSGPCAGDSELTYGAGGLGKQKDPAHMVPSPWSTATCAAPVALTSPASSAVKAASAVRAIPQFDVFILPLNSTNRTYTSGEAGIWTDTL